MQHIVTYCYQIHNRNRSSGFYPRYLTPVTVQYWVFLIWWLLWSHTLLIFCAFPINQKKKKSIFPVCFWSGNYYAALHRLVCNVFKSIVSDFQKWHWKCISFHFITSSFLLEAWSIVGIKIFTFLLVGRWLHCFHASWGILCDWALDRSRTVG